MKVGSLEIKTKTIIKAGIIISVLVIMISVILSGFQDPYTLEILRYRKDKDEHFKSEKDSPIDDQISFRQLSYFEPDKDYRIKPELILLKDTSLISIVNNDGEKNKYKRFALAVFEINDKKDTLTIFKKASLKKEDKNYFLPFFDETNDKETYTGGRYIDLEIADPNSCILDFNFAYNPYCVYNHRFSCPVPPAENKINSRVEAGEKAFVK
jgi:uncharacterized protein (DUF1684 family)